MNRKIPISRPSIDTSDVNFVAKILAEGQVSGRAPIVREFEDSFGTYLGTKHAISCCNGTVALHLAVKSLELAEGDEVVIPAFTMMSPLFALMYERLRPVLADVDAKYWITTPELIEDSITSRTKAILVVHTYGNVVEMDHVMEIASKHGLAVIEDGAEALGATFKGRKAGTFGDVSVFSFFANKLITTGEGGIVCTNNSEIAESIRSCHDLYFGKKNKFLHENLGYNYRLSALQAALGKSQLAKAEDHLAKIRSIARLYRESLIMSERIALHEEPPNVSGSYWMYSVVMGKGLDRDVVSKILESKGIETRPFFVPAHQQPVCQEMFIGRSFPASELISARGLNLPSSLSLSPEDVHYVSESLISSVDQAC